MGRCRNPGGEDAASFTEGWAPEVLRRPLRCGPGHRTVDEHGNTGRGGRPVGDLPYNSGKVARRGGDLSASRVSSEKAGLAPRSEGDRPSCISSDSFSFFSSGREVEKKSLLTASSRSTVPSCSTKVAPTGEEERTMATTTPTTKQTQILLAIARFGPCTARSLCCGGKVLDGLFAAGWVDVDADNLISLTATGEAAALAPAVRS